MDRAARIYRHAWNYVKLLRRLEQSVEEDTEQKKQAGKVKDNFRSYSERFASSLERDGVLPTLAFIASKSDVNVMKELARNFAKLIEEPSPGLKKGLENAEVFAYSLIYDCYSRWLAESGLIPSGEYEGDPLAAISQVIDRSEDIRFKARIVAELSMLAVALKHLAAGAFGRSR